MPRILISNHTPTRQGGIYLLDTAAARPRPIRICEVPTRGLTRAPDGFYFVEDGGAVFHMEPESWKVTRRAETGFRWCHDLRYLDGEFVLVASRGNRVVRLGTDLQAREALQIVADENDVCHANSVESAGPDMLVSVFTLSPGIRSEKRGSRSWQLEGKVLRLDWARRSYDIVYEPLAQPHSLVWRDGVLHCCESFRSEITAVTHPGGDRRTLCRLHGFVRGLALGREAVYAGISHSRMKGNTPWKRLRHWLTSWNGVVELDPVTWAPRRELALPGTQVYDILLVDEA